MSLPPDAYSVNVDFELLPIVEKMVKIFVAFP